MSKIKVKKEVSTIDLEYSSAERIVEEITDYIERYGSGNVSFEKHYYSYEDGQYMAVMVEREETDEEYKTRMDQNLVYENQQSLRDKSEFERLKKKFG